MMSPKALRGGLLKFAGVQVVSRGFEKFGEISISTAPKKSSNHTTTKPIR